LDQYLFVVVVVLYSTFELLLQVVFVVHKMPQAHFDATVESPHVDVLVDLGNPFLNRVFDGFVKVGGVGLVHGASLESYKLLVKEETNEKSLEKLVHRAGKEAIQWGLAAGTYSGVNYGLQQALGENNWKTTLLSGALTGATLALTEPNPRHDRVVRGALTGGAIATAAAVVRNLTD
jgi:hypothetical protein